MILTEDQRKTFSAASEPLMQWLAENCHPHVAALVDSNSADLVESVAAHRTDKFIKD